MEATYDDNTDRDNPHDGNPEDENIVRLDRVRCLECGATYVKPCGGGTVGQNPGCPKCGYLGWIKASIPTGPAALRRFAEDRLRRRAARLR